MSRVEVNKIQQQCGTTLTVGGGACKTALVDATTITLGRCGGTVSLASGATQTGFGRTGTVDWVTTPKVTGDSPVTAATGSGYFLNTTAGTITLNLPAGSAGDIISMADYAGTWQTNVVTVVPNGSEKIGGETFNVVLGTEGQSVTLVYVDSTEGWVTTADSSENVVGSEFMVATGGCITCSGNCKIHTFTGPGSLVVSAASGTAANNLVSYLVVASGGGGGGGAGGSGGGSGAGAGGFRELSSPSAPYTASPLDGYPSAPNRVTVSATTYPITVAGGGAGGPLTPPVTNTNGASGGASNFSTIPSAGGGGGRGAPCGSQVGVAGGSGGGASGGNPGCVAGGAGNTPPVAPAQGFDGGSTGAFPAPAAVIYSSAGGGGATGIGGDSQPGPQAAGVGATTEITASPVTYAAGGKGGGYCAATVPIANQPDNSGSGGSGKSTGCAGGGNPALAGANGGSGVVIIRYKFQ